MTYRSIRQAAAQIRLDTFMILNRKHNMTRTEAGRIASLVEKLIEQELGADAQLLLELFEGVPGAAEYYGSDGKCGSLDPA